MKKAGVPTMQLMPHSVNAARAQDLQPQIATVAAPASTWHWPVEDTSITNFHYIGQALTPAEFRQYCIDYKATGQFGQYPPSYFVFHHTYNPDASWASISSNQATWWDRNEQGLTVAQIKTKRKPQLDAIMNFYRNTYKWDVGPHIFVDNLFIWLFTPMYYVPIAQNEGNSYYKNNILRYGIACEVVGAYDHVQWPKPIYDNVGYACACLKAVLGFELKYTPAPEDRPDLHDMQLSGHEDYSEKSCPGTMIAPEFYVKAAQDGYARYQTPTNDPLRTRQITGPPPNHQLINCSNAAYSYYNLRGGLPILGYPVKDEFWATDPNGIACSVLKCQRAAIKTSSQYGSELMLIEEEALPMLVYA